MKRAQYSHLNVSNYALVQEDKTGKLSTNFYNKAYKVTHKEGCTLTIEHEGRVLKHSTGYCKFVPNYSAVAQDNGENASEGIHLEKQDCIVNEPNRKYPFRNHKPPQRYQSLHTQV